jgi:hypothetical protein
MLETSHWSTLKGSRSNPDEKQQYRNKGVKLFKMICGVPKEFE